MNFCGKWSKRTTAGVVGTSGSRWFHPRPRFPGYSAFGKSWFSHRGQQSTARSGQQSTVRHVQPAGLPPSPGADFFCEFGYFGQFKFRPFQLTPLSIILTFFTAHRVPATGAMKRRMRTHKILSESATVHESALRHRVENSPLGMSYFYFIVCMHDSLTRYQGEKGSFTAGMHQK